MPSDARAEGKPNGSWSSLWRGEDWWAVWIGLVIISLAIAGAIRWLPRLGVWASNPVVALSPGEATRIVLLGLLLLTLTGLAVYAMRGDIRLYLAGFPVIFLISFLSLIISRQEAINSWGLEYPLWALALGLLISNTLGTPGWLKQALMVELFIKTGLVLLGAEILLSDLMAAGALGLFEVTVGLTIVWYLCYYLATRSGLSRSFACILASAVSICGVSAAIAAGGAVKGDPREVSYTISLVLLLSIPLLLLMPAVGRILGMPPAVVGAWIGGTIDTTPAVVAAGAIYGEAAMKVASIVKMSQNIMIGVVAFILALYWALRVERRPDEAPRPVEIWYRFPKFIMGFMLASIAFSLILTPTIGSSSVKGILSITKEARAWLFTMAFVSIGLNTRLGELGRIGAGRALYVFLSASLADVVLSLASAYVFFGGLFFPQPLGGGG
jgi:uncharacterized membrane protein YadS